MAKSIGLNIPTDAAERVSKGALLDILKWLTSGKMNVEQAVTAIEHWRAVTALSNLDATSGDAVRAVSADARTEIIRLMREDFDPTPPSWEGRDWDDNAEDVASKIVAVALSEKPTHISDAWNIVRRWLDCYADEEASFSRYSDEVVLDGVMTAKERRAMSAALAPAEKAGNGSFTAHEILATAEIYLASNAAESGADQLIRELCVALRSADKLNDIQIKHMVDRFLSWKLPRDTFNPDCGISFDKEPFNKHTAHPMLHEPMGTNLFDATQADAMVRYMIDGLPAATPTPPSADVALLRHLSGCARAFLQHFNPCDLAEDKAQQWQALEHQCDLADAAIQSAAATPPSADVYTALQGMVRLFDEQGNMTADFKTMQDAINYAYAALFGVRA